MAPPERKCVLKNTCHEKINKNVSRDMFAQMAPSVVISLSKSWKYAIFAKILANFRVPILCVSCLTHTCIQMGEIAVVTKTNQETTATILVACDWSILHATFWPIKRPKHFCMTCEIQILFYLLINVVLFNNISNINIVKLCFD